MIAALAGVMLRWQHIGSLPGIKYQYLLHTHSHVMFLGWVVNALCIVFVEYYVAASRRTRYVPLFWIIQMLVAGMAIAFTLQGYDVVSIVLSTLHIAAIGVYSYFFFKDADGTGKTSFQFVSLSLIFFFVSALGPFALGALAANGFGQSKWYYFSIYYYLHFQYNGVFIFGILGLFFGMLEKRNITFDNTSAAMFCKWLAIANIPAYFLSVLWAKPHYVFFILAASGALLQGYALVPLAKTLHSIHKDYWKGFGQLFKTLLFLVVISFMLKILLQLLSVHPDIAQLAYEVRHFVIAYLHLVLIGVVSLFLVAWYLQSELLSPAPAKYGIALLVTGFILTEILLIVMPVWHWRYSIEALFIASLLLLAGTVLIFISAYGSNQNLATR